MRKKKVVYVLGAGFSAPAGIPVIGNFIFRSKEQYADKPIKYGKFKEIFDIIDGLSKIKNYANVDLYNIEMVYSLLSSRALANPSKDMDIFEQYIKDVVEYHQPKFEPVKKIMMRVLNGNTNESFISDAQKNSFYSKFVFGLSGKALLHRHIDSVDAAFPQASGEMHAGSFTIRDNLHSDCEYSVVSFNYDQIIERASEALNDTYGWNGGLIDLSPIKLHGCLSGSIIPPTWNKILTVDGIKEKWIRAFEKISNANEIRFIGFSLPETDMHAKTFFSACFSESENIQRIDIICLDDKSDTVRNRYEKFFCFPRLRFKNTDTESYIESVFRPRLIETSKAIAFPRIEDAHNNFFS
jgi:hypothetical protein